MPEACPFCGLKPLVGDEPVFTLRDKHPVSPGHSLIVTRRHFSSIADATLEEEWAIVAALRRVRQSLHLEFAPDGFNFGLNDGVAAGQTIAHLHVHVIPRFHGDTPDPRGGVRRCVDGKGAYP